MTKAFWVAVVVLLVSTCAVLSINLYSVNQRILRASEDKRVAEAKRLKIAELLVAEQETRYDVEQRLRIEIRNNEQMREQVRRLEANAGPVEPITLLDVTSEPVIIPCPSMENGAVGEAPLTVPVSTDGQGVNHYLRLKLGAEIIGLETQAGNLVAVGTLNARDLDTDRIYTAPLRPEHSQLTMAKPVRLQRRMFGVRAGIGTGLKIGPAILSREYSLSWKRVRFRYDASLLWEPQNDSVAAIGTLWIGW